MKISFESKANYFVTSDMHFGHKNIIKYSNRPFSSVEEMEEKLIENWNGVVGKNDIVFNLGDFGFCSEVKIKEILSQLNGSQIFIYGNHDKVLQRESVMRECINKKYVKVFCDYVEFSFNKTFICMSHYAMRVWNKHQYGSLMLYGHSHGTLPGLGRSMDVGLDSVDINSNYKPFLLEDVVSYLKNKEIV